MHHRSPVMPPLLFKSRFLKGRQCARRLWLSACGIPEPNIESEDVWGEREAEGKEVERVAEGLFRDLVRISEPVAEDGVPEPGATLEEREGRTRTAIAGRRVVFQAHLIADD